MEVKYESGSELKSKFRSFSGSKWSHAGPWTHSMEACRIKKIVPWRVCRPLVADSHHFDEEQDPDPHIGEKSDLDPH
jgi:hypothetical protein